MAESECGNNHSDPLNLLVNTSVGMRAYLMEQERKEEPIRSFPWHCFFCGKNKGRHV